jgi:uncharacterized Zn finger protein (UPF0148 family)
MRGRDGTDTCVGCGVRLREDGDVLCAECAEELDDEAYEDDGGDAA